MTDTASLSSLQHGFTAQEEYVPNIKEDYTPLADSYKSLRLRSTKPQLVYSPIQYNCKTRDILFRRSSMVSKDVALMNSMQTPSLFGKSLWKSVS